ncbi:hypothetical protein DOJK_00140 [Patescibacteria group bacterium]|nr:hypothetical protein DOJK_00140 [Patescibacteria group bacterium]
MSLLIDYFALCWFRHNPNELFPSKKFIINTIIFYLVIGMIVEFLIADVEGIIEVALRFIMANLSIAALLLYLKQWEDFKQLLTGIFVCENLIMVLATATEAVYFILVRAHYRYAEEVSIAIAVLLVIWYLAIIAYILRQMFEFKMMPSWILAFSYFVLTYGLPMMTMDM